MQMTNWLRGWLGCEKTWAKRSVRLRTKRAALRGRREAETLETRSLPATLVVNSLADNTSADGMLTLREAVNAVNLGSSAGLDAGAISQISGTLGANDTIQFDLALSNGTITLSAGEFLLERSMTISGTNAPGLAIDGGASSRIFNIDDLSPGAGITVSLANLVLFNGLATGGHGGAILNVENLNVSRVLFAINSTDQSGGALFTFTSGVTNISESTFHQNSASDYGGAIFAYNGTLNIVNSTISENQSLGAFTAGGGIYSLDSTVTITNSTIVLNTVNNTGGGLFSQGTSSVTLRNTIVAGNIIGNIFGGIADDIGLGSTINSTSANNLIGDPSSSGVLSEGVNNNRVGDGSGSLLPIASILVPGTPADNGGGIPTHALVTGSRAIDAGNNTLATSAGLTTDQRGAGFNRFNGTVDIGAFEVQAPISPGTLAFSAADYSVNEDGVTATITVTRTGGSSGAVTVNYATSNGTATADSDYTATSGWLFFANGQTSGTFSIAINDDLDLEGAETFTLTISNPTGGASLGSQSSATLTIVDIESISGTVFNDLNLNGMQDGSEPGLAGVFVELWADGGNGTRDYGVGVGADDIRHELTLTDASGNYQFVNPPTGLTYFIRELVPNPFAATRTAGVISGAGAGLSPDVVETVNGTPSNSFTAYSPTFTGGVRVATGDVNNDGVDDIITAPGPGGSPLVKVFSGTDGAELKQFLAYSSAFSGGVYVASGDVNGDGFDDIITGPDAGGGPHVKVFSGNDGTLIASFSAFSLSFTGGVRVAAGDVNGDGFADIITGTGVGSSQVNVYNGRNLAPLASFLAYPSFTGGVFVASGDVNGDGFDDIITGADAGAGPYVHVFSGSSSAQLAAFFAFSPTFTGGVRVAAGDVNGDGRADIIAGTGSGTPTKVSTFDLQTSTSLGTFSPFGLSSAGVYVASPVERRYQDGPQAIFSTTSIADLDLPNALPIDLGDAPHTLGFPTLLSSGGAWHFATGPMLGASRDTEADGVPTSEADSDDITGSDDEDGVTIPTLIIGRQVSITVNASAAGKLDAWIDVNGNGTLEGSEQIATSQTLTVGNNTLMVDVPSDAPAGAAYARFRISSAGGLSPGGGALDGEVEDYLVQFRAPTDTTVSSSLNSSVVGQSVTFTATVRTQNGDPILSGSVIFVVDGANQTPLPLNGSGQAVFSSSSLAVGTHTVTATFIGDSNFPGSMSSTLSHSVDRANTTTGLISSLNPSVIGQSVTFTALVSSIAPGSGTPTGTVTFSDGATPLITAVVNGAGQAVFTTSVLTVGTHNITVTYNGNANFNSSSTAVSQVVQPLESALAISAEQVTAAEGNASLPATTPFRFTITRSGNTTVSTNVSYTVSGATPNATTPTDFNGGLTGNIAFAPGEVSKQITIPVIGDTNAEPDETFVVNITSNSLNTVIVNASATSTILNDDLAPNIEIIRGILYVRDTVGRADNITVSLSGLNIIVADPDNQFLVRLGTTSTLTNTALIPYRSVSARKIVFDLAGQSDVLTIENSLPSSMSVTVNGGNGDDVITSGLCFAVINGDDGGDTLSASPIGTTSSLGRVILNGGPGIDMLTGGNANDTIIGGSDGDSIVGGGGNDKLYGESGSDTIYGGLGNDAVDGGTESDTVYGDAGLDSVFGGDGDDLLYGDSDVASITDGGDKLFGGSGSDQIFAGGGSDVAYGDTTVIGAAGGGNDIIDGGTGNDYLRGGSGNDCILGDAGTDRLYGDDGTDTLDGGTENDTVVGGNGNDALLGGDGPDRLYGDSELVNSIGMLNGNDTISGGNGNDQLYGGAGNDYLAGEAGSDAVRGESGTDTITGGSGFGSDLGDLVTDTPTDKNDNLVLVFNNITKLFEIMGV